MGKNTVVDQLDIVYLIKNRGRATKVVVTPGKQGSRNPYGTFLTTKFSVANKWAVDGNLAYDYGIITVNADIIQSAVKGAKLGYKAVNGTSLLNQTRRVQGYPGNKPSIQQYATDGSIAVADGKHLLMRKITAPGMSGAPMFPPKFSGVKVADGILIAGNDKNTTGMLQITKEIYDAISLYAK